MFEHTIKTCNFLVIFNISLLHTVEAILHNIEVMNKCNIYLFHLYSLHWLPYPSAQLITVPVHSSAPAFSELMLPVGGMPAVNTSPSELKKQPKLQE